MMGKLYRKHDRRVLEAEEAAVMKAQGLIEWIMDTRGISNKELAERLDVSQAAISQMLGLSPKNLSVKKIARVLHALGDELVITSKSREDHLLTKHAEERALWIEVMVQDALKRDNAPKYELHQHANDDYAMEHGSAYSTFDVKSVWFDKSEMDEVA
jgi:transcriptional regulator with XRE-family HTH domain